jgi:hypothetical protein
MRPQAYWIPACAGKTLRDAISSCARRFAGFLFARKDVEKRRFLRTSGSSFGESADLGQVESTCSSGELIVSVWS